MNNGFRMGRVAGIDVFIDWSLLIIFMLITFSLAVGVFPAWHPAWGAGVTWLTAFASALLFLGSVFVHELSHALVGRAQGMEIRRITLFIFGGMAHLEREPHTWRSELWMAIVGPITSLVLGVLFVVLGSLAAGEMSIDPENPRDALSQLGPLATLLFWLGPVNIILGLFNLVPGFPLDGGRVLRAILWGITRDLRVATRWASNMGQAFAWLLMITGFGMMLGLRMPIFGTGLINGLWLAFIGWFLNNAALMSYRQLLIKESLENVPVARVMKTDFATVDPDMPVQALVDDYLLHRDQRAYPVIDGERLVGLVCQQDVRKVAREAWAQTKVRDIWTPADAVSIVHPDDDAAEAMHRLSQRNVNQLPVVEGGRVRGLLRREDILKWLALRGELNLDASDTRRST
ncbi:MAG: CBS domain-containing protein [Gammaproteobacteria bacterium]|nr:CBS domain-containing protein [Gammaproteobacteria bacterium]NIR84075.1 CBS domain-containing protein [Gammaproteobacteria bacterium]NIR89219.1 CBS domain-containing protein [Gammaproteobacteria bacterium]NIU05021.1 CBS domain-containing protein [Gammaproteobacteria bacterium]NIV52187.1 CBS domain-containing protein [Gammaproteobacteria bacterium]